MKHVGSGATAKGLGVGIVQAVRTLAGCDQVLVQFFERGVSRWLPFQTLNRVKPIESRASRGEVGSYSDHAERFRLRVLAYALKAWDENTGALGRLDIDPLPHQIHVAHRVVSSGSANWVIADDVGLGKTIEVGLILHALRQRNRCRRVLVVCPSGLVRQWQDEMRFKFDQTFEIYGRDFRIEDTSLWRLHDNVIVSLDLAKRERHRALFQQAGSWDVVIFDEAHRLGRDGKAAITDRHRLAMALRALTPAMLLLTATPHQGRTDRFATLLELARPDLREELATLSANPEIVGEIVIRNRKSRVTDATGEPIFSGHDTHRIAVDPSRSAHVFDQALQGYLRDGYALSAKVGARGRAIGFVMTTYRKLASSSIAAISRALTLRRERLLIAAGTPAGATYESVEEMIDAGEIETDSLADNAQLFGAAAFFDGEIDTIDKLLQLAESVRAADEKRACFLEKVAAPLLKRGEKLLVFSEYRATQTYLVEGLHGAFPEIGEIAVINGSMKLDDKIEAVRSFNDGPARVLVSTEAGGEGLNLHRACHVMVNYDLPWNPSRLVQRIGRLYRYGQTLRVIVFNMQTRDSFDNTALALMIDRVQTIAQDLAAVAGDQRETIEAEILGELLENIDLEAILEQATQMRIELTEADINQAIDNARAAQLLQDEMLAYADRFDGVAGVGGAGVDHRHVRSFVIGMLPFAEISAGKLSHRGGVLEITLSDEQVGLFPEFGRRRQVALGFDRELARDRPDIFPVDFESHFFQTLVEIARKRAFDGLFAGIAEEASAQWLGFFFLRWQNDQGEPLEDELLGYRADRNGCARKLGSDEVGALLLDPLTSIAAQRDTGEAVGALRCQIERDTARAVSRFRQPSSIFLLAAASICSPQPSTS